MINKNKKKMIKNYETFTFKADIESKLSNNYIADSINKFFNDILKTLNSSKEIHITYKVKFYKDKKKFTLLKRTVFTFEELKLLQGLVNNLFNYNKEDILKTCIVDKIIIKYKICNKNDDRKISTHLKLGPFRIPMTMDLNTWGETMFSDSNMHIIRKKNTKLNYQVDLVNALTNKVTLFEKNKVSELISFTDIRSDGDSLNTFIRLFKHHVYYICNGSRFFELNKRVAVRLNKNNYIPVHSNGKKSNIIDNFKQTVNKIIKYLKKYK